MANRDMTSKVKAARIVLIVASQVGRPSICISGPFCGEDNRPEMTNRCLREVGQRFGILDSDHQVDSNRSLRWGELTDASFPERVKSGRLAPPFAPLML